MIEVQFYNGLEELCGDVPNHLDVTEGRNSWMRVNRTGPDVLDGGYKFLVLTSDQQYPLELSPDRALQRRQTQQQRKTRHSPHSRFEERMGTRRHES